MSLRLLVVVFVSGCTVANPLYSPGADLSSRDGLIGTNDGSMSTMKNDLSMMSPPPDLATGCTQRGCSSTASLQCDNGSFAADRTCPMDSTCANGYCGVPTGNDDQPCTQDGFTSEAICAGGGGPGPSSNPPSCQPFVVNGDLSWYCAPAVGTGLPGMKCTDGSICRSGICGANGTCFRACATATDCPAKTRNCVPVQITVEGTIFFQNGCVPLVI